MVQSTNSQLKLQMITKRDNKEKKGKLIESINWNERHNRKGREESKKNIDSSRSAESKNNELGRLDYRDSKKIDKEESKRIDNNKREGQKCKGKGNRKLEKTRRLAGKETNNQGKKMRKGECDKLKKKISVNK